MSGAASLRGQQEQTTQVVRLLGNRKVATEGGAFSALTGARESDDRGQ